MRKDAVFVPERRACVQAAALPEREAPKSQLTNPAALRAEAVALV